MPASIEEPARSVPVAEDADLCVIGGSCTGVFAAVAAARLGLRVALVEACGCFGGMATAGLVVVWHKLVDTERKREIIAGLTAEVLERLKHRNAVAGHGGDQANFAFNPEELKIELDRLVTEAGVRPFLHCRFVAPVMEGGRVTAAIVEDKSGRRAIRARTFVDATGDGDLLVRAGFETRKLDDLQPPTTCPVFFGLEKIREQHSDFRLAKVVFDPAYPQALPRGFLWTAPMVGLPDCTMVAGTRVSGADCSEADELTRAEIEGRRQTRAMADVLREHFPGGDKVVLERLPACIGIRETRHAECVHQLSMDDVLSGRRFEDAIGNGSYPVDVHHSSKPGITFHDLDGRTRYVVPGQPAQEGRWRDEQDENPTFYQIPYRSLVPRGAENMLAAGRLMDADRHAYGAIRVMVNCNQTGQAAGVASALAVQAGVSVGEVDPQELRTALKQQGAAVL